MDDREFTKIITEAVLKSINENEHRGKNQIPIAISNRHAHLSPQALEGLFGKGYGLKKLKDLSQPGQFAAEEKVTLIGPKGKIPNVRILGPARGSTQVEISLFDGHSLGVIPPIRDSGDLEGSSPVTIQGPKGQLKLDQGLICAARHIHVHPDDAKELGVSDGKKIKVHVPGPRGVTFENVLIRVSPKYRLEMHIDLDEANAAGIKNGQIGEIIRD